MEPLFSEEIKKAVESLLFVAGEPLTVAELAEYIEAKEETILEILWVLNEEYKNKGFSLMEIAGGWQFMTRPEYYHYVERLYQPKLQRLSRAAMETLAIIAYCQPITRGEIEEIRGVNADGIVSGLLEKGLVDEVGRKETPGKPILYGTNGKFLELLGLNSLTDLPIVDLDKPKESIFNDDAEKNQCSLFDNTEQEKLGDSIVEIIDEKETINEV